MNGYLLDTDVVSIIAPGRPPPPPNFIDWLERADREGKLFLCVITIHEIERGAALLEAKGASAKARALKGWLSGLVAACGERILTLDAEAAASSGRCEARALAAGHDPDMSDASVAGIATARGLVVVTRHAHRFEPFGVPLLTPEAAGQAP